MDNQHFSWFMKSAVVRNLTGSRESCTRKNFLLNKRHSSVLCALELAQLKRQSANSSICWAASSNFHISCTWLLLALLLAEHPLCSYSSTMEWCTPYAFVKASVQSICGDEEGAQATMAKNREQSPIQTAVQFEALIRESLKATE
jgi:hypothetical protein